MSIRSSSEVVVFYRLRGYSYEEDWVDAFRAAGCRVTSELSPVEGAGYVLLHGLVANNGEVEKTAAHLKWLGGKKVKKLALVVNEHKHIERRRHFFRDAGITVGSQSDKSREWEKCIWVPPGMNPDVYREIVPRAGRRHEVGFRGAIYGAHQGKVDGKRNHIVEYFARLYPEVKAGQEHFIYKRGSYVKFLNSIKATPSAEGGHVEMRVLLHRHLDAIGCKVVNVMYPGSFNGILDESNFVRMNVDHSNSDEILAKLSDEGFCEELTSRTREKMCDTQTTHIGVRKILDWLTT